MVFGWFSRGDGGGGGNDQRQPEVPRRGTGEMSTIAEEVISYPSIPGLGRGASPAMTFVSSGRMSAVGSSNSNLPAADRHSTTTGRIVPKVRSMLSMSSRTSRGTEVITVPGFGIGKVGRGVVDGIRGLVGSGDQAGEGDTEDKDANAGDPLHLSKNGTLASSGFFSDSHQGSDKPVDKGKRGRRTMNELGFPVHWPNWRVKMRVMVQHKHFEQGSIVIILTHVVSLAIMVEVEDGDVHGVAAIVSYITSSLMLIEWALRVSIMYLRDWLGWFPLDTAILLGCGCMAPCLRLSDPSGLGKDLEWLHVLSALRLFRVVSNTTLELHRSWLTIGFVLSHFAVEMASFIFLGSILGLISGLCATVYIGGLLEDDQDSEVGFVADYYFGNLARSMLTMMESFFGGLDWDSQLVEPLRKGGRELQAYALLAVFCIATCALFNLVLGLFVMEVRVTSHEYDKLQESKTMTTALKATEKWKRVIEGLDTDDDGRITRKDLDAYDDVLAAVGGTEGMRDVISAGDVRSLWEALLQDEPSHHKEQQEVVPVNDMFLCILRLAGVPFSQNMFTVQHQQQVLVRELQHQETHFNRQMQRLEKWIGKVTTVIEELAKDADRLRHNVAHGLRRRAYENEKSEERMKRLTDSVGRKKGDMHDEYANASREVAYKLRSQIQDLHHQVMGVAEAHWHAYLWEIALQDIPALRVAVRRRMDAELWPRLANDLARKGRDFATFTGTI